MDNWQNLCSSLAERNAHLLETGIRSDCRFFVGILEESKVVIDAHKLLLANASSVFERMFYGSLPENGEKAIVIDDIETEDFRDLLSFIYTEKVNIISTTKAQLLYCAADKYDINHLMKECINYLSTNLTGKNVCEVIEFAQRFEENDLEKLCMKVLLQNTREVLTSETFYRANLSTLDTILSHEEHATASELELFQAVEKYALHRYSNDQLVRAINENQENTDNIESETQNCDELNCVQKCKDNKVIQEHQKNDIINLLNLVKKIRFLSMTPHEFARGPAISNLLSKADALGLFACLIEPKNHQKHFPHGFCESTENRSKLLTESDLKRKFEYGQNRHSIDYMRPRYKICPSFECYDCGEQFNCPICKRNKE